MVGFNASWISSIRVICDISANHLNSRLGYTVFSSITNRRRMLAGNVFSTSSTKWTLCIYVRKCVYKKEIENQTVLLNFFNNSEMHVTMHPSYREGGKHSNCKITERCIIRHFSRLQWLLIPSSVKQVKKVVNDCTIASTCIATRFNTAISNTPLISSTAKPTYVKYNKS